MAGDVDGSPVSRDPPTEMNTDPTSRAFKSCRSALGELTILMASGSVAVAGTEDTRTTRGNAGSKRITGSLETSFAGTRTWEVAEPVWITTSSSSVNGS